MLATGSDIGDLAASAVFIELTASVLAVLATGSDIGDLEASAARFSCLANISLKSVGASNPAFSTTSSASLLLLASSKYVCTPAVLA